MKRSLDEGEEGQQGAAPEEIPLLDDIWHRIVLFAHLSSPTELLAISMVSTQLRRVALANEHWLDLFHAECIATTGLEEIAWSASCTQRNEKFRAFMTWLDEMIGRNQLDEDSNLCVIPKDDKETAREFILFKPDASPEARNDYDRYPDCVQARLRFGLDAYRPLVSTTPVKEGDKRVILPDIVAYQRGANVICQRIADMINVSFKSVRDSVRLSQTNEKSDDLTAFRVAPLFPTFKSDTLWYQLFKMCYLDYILTTTAISSFNALGEIYADIELACGHEHAREALVRPRAIVSGHVTMLRATGGGEDYMDLDDLESGPLVADRRIPGRHQQEDTYAAISGFALCCVCNMALPEISSSITEEAFACLNPYGRNGLAPGRMAPMFCSSNCLIRDLTAAGVRQCISCSNEHCRRPIEMSLAFASWLQDPKRIGKRSRYILYRDPIFRGTSVRITQLWQEDRQTFTRVFGVTDFMQEMCKEWWNYLTDGISTVPLPPPLPTLPVAAPDAAPAGALQQAIDLLAGAGGGDDEEEGADSPTADDEYIAKMSRKQHYIVQHLPPSRKAFVPDDTYKGHTMGTWMKRFKTVKLFKGKLQDSLIPWKFIGCGLAALDAFFPLPRLTRVGRPVPEGQVSLTARLHRNDAFCSTACKWQHDHNLKPPMFTTCLNPECQRPFNLAFASLTLECFEVTFHSERNRKAGRPSEIRGYVCDYYCRDIYMSRRRQQCEEAVKIREQSQRSPQKNPSPPQPSPGQGATPLEPPQKRRRLEETPTDRGLI